ncbi:DUF2784 domain-containing protein [Chitinibacter sp. S2-10]|uniref:DUF2784 domain-containing protein n=1 Tax=Chitinibacter sp. S2-10 TaxID=3373597 RepID=UPI003977A9A1
MRCSPCYFALVLFVVGGLGLVLIGNWLKWGWVNTLCFRAAHLATITFVAAEAWLGMVCPLTTLEMWLRSKSNVATYQSSFIAHWLQVLLFWDLPAWVFIAVYTAFALAVLAAWWFFPPRHRYKE